MAKNNINSLLPEQYDSEKERSNSHLKKENSSIKNIFTGLVVGTQKGIQQSKVGVTATAESLYNTMSGNKNLNWTEAARDDLRIINTTVNKNFETSSTVFQISSGLGEYVAPIGLAVTTGGTGGLVLGGITAGAVGGGREYADLTESGVDHSTAMKSSGIAFTKEAALATMPIMNIYKKSKIVDAGLSIAAPVAAYSGGTYVQGKYLQHVGYDKQGEKRLVEATDPTSIALNTALAGALHGVGRGIQVTVDKQVDKGSVAKANEPSVDEQIATANANYTANNPQAANTSSDGGIKMEGDTTANTKTSYKQTSHTPTDLSGTKITYKNNTIPDQSKTTTYESPYSGEEVKFNPEQQMVFDDFIKSGQPHTPENMKSLYDGMLFLRTDEQIAADTAVLNAMKREEAVRKLMDEDDTSGITEMTSKQLDDAIEEEMTVLKGEGFKIETPGDRAAFETKSDIEAKYVNTGVRDKLIDSVEQKLLDSIRITPESEASFSKALNAILRDGDTISFEVTAAPRPMTSEINRGKGNAYKDLNDKAGIPVDSITTFVPNNTLSHLPIKSSESMAGGQVKGTTRDFATVVSNQFGKDIKYFSGFNDKYHQGKGGRHPKGQAFDLVLNTTGLTTKQANAKAAEITKQIQTQATTYGFQVKLLDEYNHPSKNATGGHIHVSILGRKKSTEIVEVPQTVVMTVGGVTKTFNINRDVAEGGLYQWKSSGAQGDHLYSKARDKGVSHNDAVALHELGMQESGMNYKSVNKSPGSTAKGAYQYTDKAWTAKGGTEANRFDPQVQNEIYITDKIQQRDNIKARTGYTIRGSEFVYPHMLGEEGAIHALTVRNKDPKTPMRDVFKKHHSDKTIDSIFKNNNIKPDVSVNEFLNIIKGRVEKRLVIEQGARPTTAATTHGVEDYVSPPLEPLAARNYNTFDNEQAPISKTTDAEYAANIEHRSRDLIDTLKQTDHSIPLKETYTNLKDMFERTTYNPKAPKSSVETPGIKMESEAPKTAKQATESNTESSGTNNTGGRSTDSSGLRGEDKFQQGEAPTANVRVEEVPPATNSVPNTANNTARGVGEFVVPNSKQGIKFSNKDIVPTVRQAADDIGWTNVERGSYKFRKTKDGTTEVVTRDGTLLRHKEGSNTTITHNNTTWSVKDSKEIQDSIDKLIKTTSDSSKEMQAVYKALDDVDQTKPIRMGDREMLPSEWKNHIQKEQETLRTISRVADDVFLCSIGF